MSTFVARFACLFSGHQRVMAAMRAADGRFLPVAMCERCGASLS